MALYCYVAAAVLHLMLGGVLVAAGTVRRPRRSLTSILFLAAVLVTAAWAASGIAISAPEPAALRLNRLLDLTRYGLWLWFLLALICAPADGKVEGAMGSRTGRMLVGAVAARKGRSCWPPSACPSWGSSSSNNSSGTSARTPAGVPSRCASGWVRSSSSTCICIRGP